MEVIESLGKQLAIVMIDHMLGSVKHYDHVIKLSQGCLVSEYPQQAVLAAN